jgi:hypothetical protein
MIVGSLIAAALVATIAVGGPGDMITLAERFANDAWAAAVTAFRR